MRKTRNSFEGCVDGKNKHVLQREIGKARGTFHIALKSRVVSMQGNWCTEQKFPIYDGCTYHNLLAPSIGEKRAEGGSPLGRRWSFSFNATKRAEEG